METKIIRFVNLFFIFLILNAFIYIFDEVLPPLVRIYTITNNHKQLSFSEEFKINKDLGYTLLVEDSTNKNSGEQVLLVEVDEASYFRAAKGDKAFVYVTPIFKHIRFCLDEKHPILKTANPFIYRYPLEIKNIVMPILILILSILGYKSKIFELKFTLFLFNGIFSIVLKWMLR